MNKTFYCHTPNIDGLLNLGRGNTHIYSIDAKRCKVDNDSATYLWHCRLGHISVKHMKKLHTDRLLEPLDYESLGTCVGDITTGRKPTYLGRIDFVSS